MSDLNYCPDSVDGYHKFDNHQRLQSCSSCGTLRAAPHGAPSPAPAGDRLSPEQIKENKEIARAQFSEAKGPTKVTCTCGRSIPIRFAYKCLYCDIFRCMTCAEAHFGKSRKEYFAERHPAPATPGSVQAPAAVMFPYLSAAEADKDPHWSKCGKCGSYIFHRWNHCPDCATPRAGAPAAGGLAQEAAYRAGFKAGHSRGAWSMLSGTGWPIPPDADQGWQLFLAYSVGAAALAGAPSAGRPKCYACHGLGYVALDKVTGKPIACTSPEHSAFEGAGRPITWTRAKPDCELCKGTGWYGDRGPGRKGNSEYQPCECTQRPPEDERSESGERSEPAPTPYSADLRATQFASQNPAIREAKADPAQGTGEG